MIELATQREAIRGYLVSLRNWNDTRPALQKLKAMDPETATPEEIVAAFDVPGCSTTVLDFQCFSCRSFFPEVVSAMGPDGGEEIYLCPTCIKHAAELLGLLPAEGKN